MSLKKSILEKSGSYKFYKNNYERLLKENQELSNLIEQYKKIYPPKECPICGYKGIGFKPYVNHT